MIRGATVSPCGQYRYRLWRVWNPDSYRLAFIMLNPSKADAEVDDPTIRKCVGFAKRGGYGGIEVFNLFAYRATDPRELYRCPDPIGPDNDEYLRQIPPRVDVCLAWGAHGRRFPERVKRVEALLPEEKCLLALRCLADGTPAHPLMLPYSLELSVHRS